MSWDKKKSVVGLIKRGLDMNSDIVSRQLMDELIIYSKVYNDSNLSYRNNSK